MAALQSRARAQHQHQNQQPEEAEQQHGRESRHSSQRSQSAVGQAGEDEAWVLFAPPTSSTLSKSATPGNRAPGAPPPTAAAAAASAIDVDPFEQRRDGNHPLSSSGTVWQLVSADSPSSSALGQSRAESGPRSPYVEPLQNDGTSVEDEEDDAEEPSNANGLSRWSAVPVPRRDTSFFFDDDDEEEALFSDKLDDGDPRRQRRQQQKEVDGLFSDSNSNSNSTYHLQNPNDPNAPALRSARKRHSQDGEDTDMLSLPSSLSVSDRSSSHDLASPSFDYLETNYGLSEHIAEGPDSSNITLTEAALSRIATANETVIEAEAETALTSGSEDEGEDRDEMLLSRAPDAISAGIRPSRRRALQSIRPPSQLSSALSAGKLSSSQTSAAKRRHRHCGISDKGSKRSNTSASPFTIQDLRTSVASAKDQEWKRGSQPVHTDRHGSPTRGRAARLAHAARQAARDIFSVDEEVMNMMAQPGQSRPAIAQLQTDSTLHGLSAFSAHIASELDDGLSARGLFTAWSDDEQSNDSGEETETERDVRRRHTRRHRRRSSLLADGADQSYLSIRDSRSPGQQDSLDASLTAEQLHTASLGLHRSFSLAGLQHFLIDSVYNSLSSSMLGTPRSPSVSPSLSLNQAGSFMPARRRTHSEPSIEKSHSSSDLFGQSGQLEDQAEIVEYRKAVSYWRRVLRSFNL